MSNCPYHLACPRLLPLLICLIILKLKLKYRIGLDMMLALSYQLFLLVAIWLRGVDSLKLYAKVSGKAHVDLESPPSDQLPRNLSHDAMAENFKVKFTLY